MPGHREVAGLFYARRKHDRSRGTTGSNDGFTELPVFVVTSPQLALGIEDPDVRRLVWTRFHQITDGEAYDYDRHGELIVVEPGDSVADLEEASGCPLLHNYEGTRFGDPEFVPALEAIEDHWGCYEMVAILNDDGFGIALYVPKHPHIDADLLAMCAAHSIPAST